MSDMTRSGHRQFIESGERKYQERKSTMPTVKTVQDRTKGALLIMDDGVRIWTPDKELARTLLGKPIPEDWTRRDNENGPMALPPKPKGGGGLTAWRNTKEGFEAEAAGRRRWQEIEEERKDRRTALMQAVESTDMKVDDWSVVLRWAETLYDWLRESSPAAGPAVATAGIATTAEEPQPQAAGQVRVRGAAPGGEAGGTTSGPVAAGDLGRTPSPDPGPDSTPAASGEVAVGSEPGEGSVKTSPGSTNYPMTPDECDHKFASGGWLKTRQVDGVPVCPRCGMSAVLYRES